MVSMSHLLLSQRAIERRSRNRQKYPGTHPGRNVLFVTRSLFGSDFRAVSRCGKRPASGKSHPTGAAFYHRIGGGKRRVFQCLPALSFRRGNFFAIFPMIGKISRRLCFSQEQRHGFVKYAESPRNGTLALPPLRSISGTQAPSRVLSVPQTGRGPRV